jgi:GNAT superfamily N-acetyltransferase
MTSQTFRARGASVVLRREPWDCDRLGFEAAKVEHLSAKNEAGAVAVLKDALEAAKKARYRLLTCRLESTDRLGNAVLPQLGFYLVDTTLLLELELRQPPPMPRGVRRATQDDADALAKLSADAFSDKAHSFNRYLNDPHLSRKTVREVYGVWAATSMGGPAADLTFLTEEDGKPTGFITLVLPKQDDAAVVPLNAVAEAHRGKGLYRRLVDAALAHAGEAGAKRIRIRTQLQQVAVQRAWYRLGAIPVGSTHTWNAWLGPRR